MPSKSWLKWTLCAGSLVSVGLLAPACGHPSYAGTGGSGQDTSRQYRAPAGDVTQPRRDANPYPDLSLQNPADQGSFAPSTGAARGNPDQAGTGGSMDGQNQPGIGGSGNTSSNAQVNVASPAEEEETGTRVNRVARPRSGPYVGPWNEPNGSPGSVGGAAGSGGAGSGTGGR